MPKKIMLIILLLLTGVMFYLVLNDSKSINRRYTTSAPPLEMPKKTIYFTITKGVNGKTSFIGSFSTETTPISLVKRWRDLPLEHNITINPNLVLDQEAIDLTYKLLEVFILRYREGTIQLKEHKLLVSGTVTDKESIEKVDALLAYSTVNSFNNTKLVAETVAMASELNTLLDEDELEQEGNVSIEEDMENAMANFEAVAKNHPLKEKPFVETELQKSELKAKSTSMVQKEISSVKPTPSTPTPQPPTKISTPKKAEIPSEPVAVVVEEQTVVKKEEIMQSKPIEPKEEVAIVQEKQRGDIGSSKPLSEAEAYRLKLQQSMVVDEDLMSLPSVEILDEDAATKIETLTTKKPLVQKETIYIESNEPNGNHDIPMATLYDHDEELDGIVKEEIIAAPTNNN